MTELPDGTMRAGDFLKQLQSEREAFKRANDVYTLSRDLGADHDLAASLAFKKQKDDSMDSFEKIAQDHGIYALAKVLVDDQDAHKIDEHRYERLVTAYAKRKYPDLTEAQAFERVFMANDAGGQMLRDAYEIVKALPPVV